MEELSDVVWEVITTNGYLDQLKKLWADLGYDNESIMERKTSVCGHVQNLFQQMVEEEQGCKDLLIKKIELYLEEAATLSEELGVEIDVNFDEGIPLIALNGELQNRMRSYQLLKEQRIFRFNTLKECEDKLCNSLGIQHLTQKMSSIPTEIQLQTYEQYLKGQTEEKVRLEQIFQSSRVAIENIMVALGIKPELDFEEAVVSGQNFKLTKDNMAALKDLHQSLELRLEDAKASSAELREKLSLLWERLHEPHELRNAFVSANPGHTVSTLKALKQEIMRCEEEKRRNIMKFVEEVRRELHVWWEKCYFSEEQKNAFTALHSTFYSEDLLEMHEREADKLKRFYQSNVNIFALLLDRQNLWERRAVLESNAQHPNRLFHNRGGELLREEKERKTINKNLPKIEAELMKRVADYEADTGKTFLIFGQNVTEYVQNQRDMVEEEKEKEKLARKARNQTDGMLMGSTLSCKSSGGVKRKGCVPTTPNVTKKGRTVTRPVTVGNVNKASAQRLVRGPAITNNREDRSRHKKVARNMFNAVKSNETHKAPDVVVDTPDMSGVTSNLTVTYTDFQSHLEKTGACRSSVKPRYCLREINTPDRNKPAPMSAANRLGTPGKTPTRPPLSVARSISGISKIQMTPNKSSCRNLRTPRLTPARGKLPFLI